MNTGHSTANLSGNCATPTTGARSSTAHRTVVQLFETEFKSFSTARRYGGKKGFAPEASVDNPLHNVEAVEREGLKWLIGEIRARAEDSKFCDVKILVLKEHVRHHVRTEAMSVVRDTRERGLDIWELSQILQNVKQKLHAELTQA